MRGLTVYRVAGASTPTLQYIYQLTLRPDANLSQAVADYAAQPGVEYTQPNYLATTQSSSTRSRREP